MRNAIIGFVLVLFGLVGGFFIHAHYAKPCNKINRPTAIAKAKPPVYRQILVGCNFTHYQGKADNTYAYFSKAGKVYISINVESLNNNVKAACKILNSAYSIK